MKSIKNHLSLVVALVSILFAIQVFIIVDRAINAYKENLANNYSVIVVAHSSITDAKFKTLDTLVKSVTELSPDNVIKRLNTKIDKRNIELLKVTLPKFYKVKLKHFPNKHEIRRLTKKLLNHRYISKVENFSYNHDSTFKLLLLFKDVITVFTISVFIVTILLILKELRIWQFTHNERMSIMGLFGAPIWLSSAVLFRLAIVDAIISSIVIFGIFSSIASSPWVLEQQENIGIHINIFDAFGDFFMLFGIAISVSVVLASLIVIGHKEEV
ncbi:cell division protein FtsX [Sulfurimonas sp. SAG-AH-194-I05]|nr:cell division protein FtsX [Sulfurimonas sp. SAG-AH-194-I05]MDF1875420.1 cell division protein FtsX [Sulfurimonas sp. SAG-AH-194-I05]